MRIAVVHSRYRERGGEDAVVDAEVGLLRSRGHAVELFLARNDELEGLTPLRLGGRVLWNRGRELEFERFLGTFRPDVVHFHNVFPSLSPAVLRVPRRLGVPSVATLHNYRLSCLNGLFLREGRVCLACEGLPVALPGILHGCWRGRAASGLVASAQALHRAVGSFDAIDLWLALTTFARERAVAAGIAPERLRVRPNMLTEAPEAGTGSGGYALFVGRLVEEKGIQQAIDAADRAGVPLVVAGSGPLEDAVRRRANDRLRFVGRASRVEVQRLMQDAACVVVPSLWFEGLPLVVIEAFAAGCPVVASAHGGLASVVDDRTGILVAPGHVDELARAMATLVGNTVLRARLGANARTEFESRYAERAGYDSLLSAYEVAIAAHRARRVSGGAR